MAVTIDLTGKTILICGVAAGSIGEATARHVAAAGADIMVVDYRQEIVDGALREIAPHGGRYHGLAVDLTDGVQCDSVVPAVLERFGALDGLANITGGVVGNILYPLEDTPAENFRDTMGLNLEYVFRLCRDAARSMIARGAPGAIVNIGSVSALTSAPQHGIYGAAKSGVSALTRTMAFEWGRHGIRANTVAPGAVLTRRNGRTGEEQGVIDGKAGDIVWTSIDEMASAILFLLSDLASGISGQTLVVDSGLSTKFCSGGRPLGISKPVAIP